MITIELSDSKVTVNADGIITANAALNAAANAQASETAAATSETNAAQSEANAATSETNAGNSATAAATSETNAAASETAAAQSETNAAASEANAAGSATAAAASETAAGNSASAAAASETASAGSAAAAAQSEANASTSETNAAQSEANADADAVATAADRVATGQDRTAAEQARTGAETAETNAAGSAAAAALSETNAGNSETAAAGSASAAAGSATAAAASETNAGNSAAAAASSEANAATSEGNAATSEGNAATSETNAANSATSASASETNAANSATAAQNAQTAAETAQAAAETAETGAETAEGNVNAALAEIALFLTDNYKTEYIDKYNLEQAAFTVSNITAYKERIAELLRLFALGFRTFMTVAEKTGQVGFLKHDKNGVEMVYPPTIIQAPFTRTGTGREVIDADGNTVTLAANIPAISYPVGGQAAGKPFLSFKPADGTYGADTLLAINDLQAAGYISKNTDVGFLLQIRPKASTTFNNSQLIITSTSGSDIRLYETSNGIYKTFGWWSPQIGSYFFVDYPIGEAPKTFFYFKDGKVILYVNGVKFFESANHNFDLNRTSNFNVSEKPVDFLQFSFTEDVTEADAIAATSWTDFNEMASDLNYEIQ